MPPPDRGQRATILLVDDDAASRQAIELIIVSQPRLRALGARVVKALDGHRALAAVQAERPHLVITELSIPGMDGFAFCRAVRKLPQGAALPVLIVSGQPMNAALVADLATELQATFLPKPVQADLLADAIVSAVAGTGKRGSLAERGVARLLFDHLDAGSTGTLVVVRGQMRKEIFLRAGQVVAAESNLRQEALGALLVAKQVITEPQMQELLSETKKRGQKMGTVLVELGWFTPEEVLQYLAAQARKRVTDCLRWPDGSWSFVPGDAFADRVIEHALDTPKMLFKGLFRTAQPEEIVNRLETDSMRPVELSPRLERWRDAFESVFGRDALAVLGDGATLGSLVMRDDGQGLSLALETLLASGLGELGAPVEEKPKERAAHEAIEAFSLGRLASDASGKMRTLQAEPTDDEWSEHTRSDTPVLVSDEGGADTGPTGTSFGIGPSRTAAGDARSIILREYLELHGKSHYEVLGIAPDASREDIAAAYWTKMERFNDRALTEGDADGKLEAVRNAYARAFEALSDPEVRHGYDTDQVTPLVPELDPLGAELAFGEGQALLEAGKPAEASARFAQAVATRPDQAAYHAFLGWALFLSGGPDQAGPARERLGRALALDPDLGPAHEMLGRLAVSAGDQPTAQTHLERALEIAPDHPELVELLATVHGSLGDARAAERSYRHLIALLGEESPALRTRLWGLLADVYEGLGERDNARIAYENVARLSPGDVTAQRKVIELNAEAPDRWRESARALVAEWQVRPDDRALGASLIDLLLKAGRQDAATVAAGATVLRGVATDEASSLAAQGRPRVLRRVSRPLDKVALRRLGAPGEDEDLETVVGALAEAGVIPADPSPAGGRRVTAEQTPPPFRRVLRYACEALSTSEPPVMIVDDGTLAATGGARMADLRPCTLLVSPALADTTDTVELGFRLARALASAKTGRVAGVGKTGRQLRPYFVAVLALARGATSGSDAESTAVMGKIGSSPAGFKMVAMEVGTRLARGRRAVDLGGWTRALGRTADRMGLLLCGDLVRVGQALTQEKTPGALDDLLAFALSAEHLDLREDLGLSSVA